MSNVHIIKAVDPRINFGTGELDFIAISGSDYIGVTHVPAAQTSNSSIYIQYLPANNNTAISRNLPLHCQFEVIVTGTNTSTEKLVMDNMGAPCAHPLRTIIGSANLTLNGVPVALQNMNRYMPGITQAYDGSACVCEKEYSQTPSMPDFGSHHLTGALASSSTRSSLSGSYDQVPNYVPRAAFAGWKTVSNAASGTTARFTLDCCESITIPTAIAGKGAFDANSWALLENMQFNAQLTNLNKIFRTAYPLDNIALGSAAIPQYDPASGGRIRITNVQVNLLFSEIIFQTYSIPKSIPRPPSLVYSYPDVQFFPTTSQSPLAPGGTTTLQMNTQSLSSVPRAIYVWSPSFPSQLTDISTPAGCVWPVCALQGGSGYPANVNSPVLTLNFNNANQMQAYTLQDLYRIAAKNGCDRPFSDWASMPGQGNTAAGGSDGSGTWIKLVAGEDFVLGDLDLCVGTTGKYNLSLTYVVYNQSQYTLPAVDLNVVCIYDGYQTINHQGDVQNKVSSFTYDEVARIPVQTVNFKPTRQLFGGGSFESLKGLLTGAHDYVKKKKLVSRALGAIPNVYAQGASRVAKSFGYGYGGCSAAAGCSDSDE